jgi:hypothetical protein
MKKTTRLLAFLVPLATAIAAPAATHSTGAYPQEQKGLSEADIKKLSDLLFVMIPPKEKDGKEFKPDAKKIDAAALEFEKEFERIKKEYGPALVSDVAGWSEVSFRYRAAGGIRSPSGFGSVQEAKVEVDRASDRLSFTYAYVLPQGYDAKKKYPLVVCLHDDSESDKEYTGAKYLAEVLLKAPKELKDQFIFLAPTIGPKAGGKDVRIEFGDDNQFINVYAPLGEVLRRFSIDSERIYVEGTGRGGEFAANLVAYKPFQWAAAAIRSAVPRRVSLMTNAGDLPVAYHFRQGGKADNAKAAMKEIEAQKAAGLPIEIKSYDPLPPNMEQRARAGMNTDPVHDATGAILTYFADKKRRPPPKSFSFTSDKPMFGAAHWVRILVAEWPDAPSVTVKVDEGNSVIEVKAEHVQELRLLFHDAVWNLDRPFKVMVNGKLRHDGKLERSPDDFLKTWRANRLDPWYVPCAQIDVSLRDDAAEPTGEKPAGDKPADAGGKSGG